MRTKKFITGSICLITLSLLTSLIPIKPVSAVTAADWRAGRIIDDYVFTNKNSMSVSQVQLFLNSQLSTCDTGGTELVYDKNQGDTVPRSTYGSRRGNPAPFTCLKDYYEVPKTAPGPGLPASNYGGQPIPSGAKSAAQIIWEAAQEYDISPQVLLVTLQKEQGLVYDNWPFKKQFLYAMGAYCPDGAFGANCNENYASFSLQMREGASLFRYYLDNMQQSWWSNKKPYQNNNILWQVLEKNGTPTNCGGSSVYLENKATTALYVYTPYQPNQAALSNMLGEGDYCSAYGNRNFWRQFSDWFGSTQLRPGECDSKVSDITCVWTITKTDGSQFLTSSKAEVDLTTTTYGWMFEGVAFYASKTERVGTTATYRFQHLATGRYYYTVNPTDATISGSPSAWANEGIAFYVYPSTTTTNISHKIYRLYNSSLNQRVWTIDESKKTSLINSGYILESSPFNTFSGLANLPVPATGRNNIYRLSNNFGHFYTASLRELESVIKMGYIYEGVLTTANSANSGTPVYRLRYNNGYLYTASVYERNTAIQSYGMADEGIGFYLDTSSAQIYRLTNTERTRYLYTGSLDEVMRLANTDGWLYESTLANKVTTPSPVYRFINQLNNRHFYTIDINEASRIANKGWKYETVAFNANTSSGLPVYRLLSHDKHFYTTDSNERDNAVSRFGYYYEGIGFYVSPTSTSKPVYRLQGGNDEYFYTASSTEKDNAVNRYGYQYEGEVFYLPAGN